MHITIRQQPPDSSAAQYHSLAMLSQAIVASILATLGSSAVLKPPAPPNLQQPFTTDTFIDRSIFGHRSRFEATADALDQDLFTIESDYGAFCSGNNTLIRELPYQGVVTFAHLAMENCFTKSEGLKFDIAIVGAPFDLGVTYRPGARFGPAGARMGSRRLSGNIGVGIDDKSNPF